MTTDTLTIPEIGVYPNVPAEEYHAWPCVSNSLLGQLSKSPLHAKYAMDNGYEATEAQKLGTAAHTAILEPHLFEQEYRRGPDARTNSNEWKEAEAQADADGYTIIKPEQYDHARLMAARVYDHPAAAELLAAKGINELSVRWEKNGIPCKMRIDRGTKHAGYSTILDVKTTTDASREAFQKSVQRYGYYRQGAFYLDGLQAIDIHQGREPAHRRYIIIAVESTPPYGVGVYELDDEAIRFGRDHERYGYRSLLGEFVRCKKAGHWPSHNEDIESLSLPRWFVGSWE